MKARLTGEKLINNLKSSIFCGVKGFLTFSLAFLSYLEYSLHRNTKLREDATFAMKKNTIPFLEMMIIVPLVCFVLPAMVGSVSIVKCALICAVLMIEACLFIRSFHVREWLLEKTTNYSRGTIDTELKKDTIKFPIFNQNRRRIEYNSPSQASESGYTSFLVACLVFPLKTSQSYIMLSLAAVELLEAAPSFCVDLSFDRSSFASTKSNLQRSGYLLYASVRNLVPMSMLDGLVTERVCTSRAVCCSA
ncbi:hypothetical protein GOY12_01505 [Wolbachia endosymbiont of Dirofilaria (Dirofilaria) immitis]|nr:hypothetical protein GOY12_01505 [Wolbachia endosymbiont of Dirofilaria (Dirofilaria) immitis]